LQKYPDVIAKQITLRLEVWDYTNVRAAFLKGSPRRRTLWNPCLAGASLYSRDFQDTVGEFIGGVTLHPINRL